MTRLAFSTPSDKPQADSHMLTTRDIDPASFPLPYYIDDDGRVLVHVSTAVYWCARHGIKPRFLDDGARRLFRAWALASSRTLRNAHERTDYQWHRLFSKAYARREYQEVGMDVAYEKCVSPHFGRGELIGDDVGLGKTPQAIGVILRFREEGRIAPGRPAVVISTASLKSQWFDELRKFPKRKVSIALADGTKPQRLRALARQDSEVIIVNYEMLLFPHYRAAISQHIGRVALVVVDETAEIKAYHGSKSKALRGFLRQCGCPALTLNATPMEIAPHELVSQFAIVDPVATGSFDSFVNRYLTLDMYGRVRRVHHVKEIKTRFSALFHRRTREQVGDELPAVIAELRDVTLGARQTSLYKEVVQQYIEAKESGTQASLIAELCYRAFAEDVQIHRSRSAKLDDMLDLITRELGHEKIVVFSQYKRIVEFVASSFRRGNIGYEAIHSGVTGKARADARRRFELSDRVRVMIGTSAMCRGLNLQAAGVVINLDLPWNPAALTQRIGRVRRMSQTRSKVLVISYVAKCADGTPTIDERKVEVLGGRQKMADRFFASTGEDQVGDGAPDRDALRAFLSAARNMKAKGR